MAPQRFIKIQEFVAHAGAVTCVKIGRKSSGVLVTGGDDKKVNLWTIGTQTKALSLPGHQSPVDSVTFDHNEEIVAAGASSGSIKLFDLDQAKVTRAMSGHRSNVLCLELNMFGMVSGSMDTNVKVWDLRQKEAVNTYKGHKKGVTHVQFSPDGKWIASGSQDGQIKLWDVVAGRMLSDFQGHTHPVTGLEFHPDEYLLASSSVDKTVKIWDLETMAQAPLEQTGTEATAVRAITFHPDGQHLFAAHQDGLRVWSWEPSPVSLLDNVEVPWTKVGDVSVLRNKDKVVGCSFNQSFVGLWVVSLKEVHPFGAPPSSGGYSVSSSLEPPRRSQPSQPTAPLARSGSLASNDRRYPPAAAPITRQSSSPREAPSSSDLHSGMSKVSIAVGVGDSLLRGGENPAAQQPRAGSQRNTDIPVSVVAPPMPANRAPIQQRSSCGLGGPPPAAASSSSRAELDVIAQAAGAPHEDVMKSLGFRLSNLQMCRNFMKRGDVRGAMSAARRCGDASVGADLLAGMLSRRESTFTLDSLPELVSVLEGVLVTPNEHHVMAGLEALSLAHTAFGPLIRDTCSQAARVGVDLSFEQRRDKCMMARVALQGLTPKLEHVAKYHDALSYKAQDLSGQLATL